MKGLTLRGLKIYFRDKGGVFFSLLGVLIIFALFIFFIGDSIIEDLDWLDNSKSIMNAWVVAGMLASASITTSMGAYAQMVTDRDQKIIKDFYTSPISRASITASYMLTGFIVSVIMSVIVLVIGEAYICIKGGELLGALTYLKIFGVMLLSSFASSAMVCFIVSFMRTMASYTTVSIILGTLIGFLVVYPDWPASGRRAERQSLFPLRPLRCAVPSADDGRPLGRELCGAARGAARRV